MGYRGEDLDLRTPQTWSATPADLAGGLAVRGSYGVRNGPIWVDDTVLACCNHAFDVALLNRAGEVRLEHLLHALTRIDAAAEALEARGVRVAALRRDTATVIASEIPIGLPNGKGTPRRSEPLEEILRQAAGYAARRNGPATIDDLLHIIMDVEPNLPGLGLVARSTTRPAGFNEPMTRTTAYPEPRVSDFTERGRMPPGTYYFNEPARMPRADFHGTATDSIQNTRIDALEQMVRALGNDLATERKAFTGILHELQRDVSSQREEASRMGGGLHERLQTVDSIIERRLGELSRPWLQMHDRLQGLEHAMLNVRPSVPTDITPITERIASLERALHTLRPAPAPDLGPLAERIGSLERAVSSARPAAADTGPVMDRIAQLERTLLNTNPVSAADLGPMSEHVAALERAVQASLADSARQAEMLAIKVKAVETALSTRPSVVDGQIDMAPLTQRLDMIEEAVLSREAATRDISDRLSRQEDMLAADRGTIRETYERLLSEMKSLAGTIDREGGETASTVLDSLSARLEGLAGVIEGRHSETAQALASNTASMAQLIERLAATETAAREQAQRLQGLQGTYGQELGEVHDALMKLNTNQHTLAGSIDRWHQDSATTLSLFGSRMETVEREVGRPVAMLESMGHTMDRLHKVTAERYYRRNRFWYWLFGTDDWIASSWPNQASRIVDDPRMTKPKR